MSWVLAMVRRELRHEWQRLLLYTIAIAVGVTVLSATGALRSSLNASIIQESRNLLGADLKIQGRTPFDATQLIELHQVAEAVDLQTSFRSMARFPAQGASRFVQVYAVSEQFPVVGDITTTPLGIERPVGNHALVEESLLVQQGLKVGDPILLGEAQLTIVAALRKVGGGGAISSAFAPRVYISQEALTQSKLLQFGSIADYTAALRLPHSADAAQVAAQLATSFPSYQYDIDTADDTQASLGDLVAQVAGVFALSGTLALLVGAIGVGSAIRFFLSRKLKSFAVLRCIGAPFRALLAIYTLEVLAMALVGSLLGIVSGFVLAALLIAWVRERFELALLISFSLEDAIVALIAGAGGVLLFALPALLELREVRPMAVLKSVEEALTARFHLLATVLCTAIAGLLLGAHYAADTRLFWGWVIGLPAGLALVCFGTTILRRGLVRISAAARYQRLPYPLRLGLRNLNRPGGAAASAIVALSVGLLLVVVVVTAHHLFGERTSLARLAQRANIILIDIQPDQRTEVTELLQREGFNVFQDVPIVLMRITELDGQSREALLEDDRVSAWSLRREYWSTYRDRTTSNERVTAGEFTGAYRGEGPVPISLEQRFAGRLGVQLGDRITFDVQGVPIDTEVTSLREVYWERMERNSLVLFPSGVLEEAPQFYFLSTHAQDAQQAAQIQSLIAQQFPNVSVVDLRLTIETLRELVDTLALAALVLAGFTVLAALAVLAVTLLASQEQQVLECSLLRTLGGSRRQIRGILIGEGLAIVAVSLTSALTLTPLIAYPLARWVFKVDYSLPGAELVLIGFIALCGGVSLSWLLALPVLRRVNLAVVRSTL